MPAAEVAGRRFLQFYYKIMNYDKEAPYEKLAAMGLSSDYVFQETKRVIAI